jgi:hypothetical protein
MNLKASIKTTKYDIRVRSKKYKITKYLSVQFFTVLNKEVYGHNKKEKLKKHINEWTDKLYEAAKQCILTDPNDPIFKKKFKLPKFQEPYGGVVAGSEVYIFDNIELKFYIMIDGWKPFLMKDVQNIYDCLKSLLTW